MVRPADFGAVSEVTVSAYVGDGFIAPGSGYVTDLSDTATRAAGAEIWVAVDGDEVLGAVTWCPRGSSWREIARADEGEFRMLAVAPSARGRGAGEALVRHCVDLARAAGFSGMVLGTMAQMTAAHRIYLRLGFERAPEQDWSPVPGIDLWAFRLRF